MSDALSNLTVTDCGQSYVTSPQHIRPMIDSIITCTKRESYEKQQKQEIHTQTASEKDSIADPIVDYYRNKFQTKNKVSQKCTPKRRQQFLSDTLTYFNDKQLKESVIKNHRAQMLKQRKNMLNIHLNDQLRMINNITTNQIQPQLPSTIRASSVQKNYRLPHLEQKRSSYGEYQKTTTNKKFRMQREMMQSEMDNYTEQKERLNNFLLQKISEKKQKFHRVIHTFNDLQDLAPTKASISRERENYSDLSSYSDDKYMKPDQIRHIRKKLSSQHYSRLSNPYEKLQQKTRRNIQKEMLIQEPNYYVRLITDPSKHCETTFRANESYS